MPSHVAEVMQVLDRRFMGAGGQLSATVTAGVIRANLRPSREARAGALVEAALEVASRYDGSIAIDAAPQLRHVERGCGFVAGDNLQRFGNIYTVRQLLQLFQRAYGLFDAEDSAWRRADGAWLDPFRPRIQAAGFASAEALERDREAHLGAVREMFEQCDVFVFTLGLTEAWVSAHTGAVVPLAPGVVGGEAADAPYDFCNFEVAGMTADMLAFIDNLRRLNPDVRIVLTVSPVPLIATYERRHVLVSTTYSKAALRVVADAVSRARPDVAYFPSYEIITGPQSGGRFYESDLREIRPEGVAHVMGLFRRHFLEDSSAGSPRPRRAGPARDRAAADLLRQGMTNLEAIVCDEEALDAPPAQEALAK